MTGSIHLHIGSFIIAFILFFVTIALHKSGNKKGEKIVSMILRLFYLVIIVSGAILLIKAFSIDPVDYTLKTLFGIIVIGFMEMVLARMNKGKKAALFWLLLIISVIIVTYLGYKLPLTY